MVLLKLSRTVSHLNDIDSLEKPEILVPSAVFFALGSSFIVSCARNDSLMLLIR